MAKSQRYFCVSQKLLLSLLFEAIGSVVQWIEYKIPVLTIAVRIRSESHCCVVDNLKN